MFVFFQNVMYSCLLQPDCTSQPQFLQEDLTLETFKEVKENQ